MSKSLVKLVDVALLPASLMVVSKFIGLIITVYLFQIDWDISNITNNLQNFSPLVASENIVTLSTYSDLIMYLLLATAFSFILVQATHFHETHIKPRLLIKLNNHNLTGLIKSSFEIYHSAAIWLINIWIATVLIWINVLSSNTQAWVGIATALASVTFTTILLQDVYKEIDASHNRVGGSAALQ